MGGKWLMILTSILLMGAAVCPAMAQSDYVCGDANGDGAINVGDAVFMINYVFRGGPAPEPGCCEGCSEGMVRLCYTGPPETQGVGACAAGIEMCVGGEWGPCTGEVLPSAEICDGYDNDCDGEIDEDFPGLGDPCTVGQGECREWGIMICTVDGSGIECSATPGSASTEICDGLDNDCDGEIDEGFDVGAPCTDGQGECLELGIMVCTGDGTGTECSAVAGPGSPEICDGIDNDCDGEIDEGFNVGEPCSAGIGVCKEYGVMVCTMDGSGTECSATPGSSSPEICDGLDNDCDGEIDEGFDVGAPCTDGQGECLELGIMVCTGDGLGTECSAVAGPGSPEICDGIDNDCDGEIDEGFDVGEPCSVGIGVCKEYGVMVCTMDGSTTECSATPGSSSPEICDGLDNDCDGEIDEGFDVGAPCTDGQGECLELGIMVCTGDGLGTECSAVAGPGSPEICDGIDNDCDGEIDEGFDVGEPCSVGIGVCKEYGVMVCTMDGSTTECSATPGSSSPEICDGLDNDCDGEIDEGFDVGAPCTDGQGECQELGIMVCTGDGLGTECSAVAGPGSPEICDGIDNDCDGEIDEGFDVGEPCSVGIGECKEYGVMVCTMDGSTTECSATPGSSSPEICDGLDNDCDGEIDEGFDIGQPCSVGVGECREWGVKVCTMDGSSTECSASPGTPTAEICNDHLDNDCDGLIDEADPDCP